jgi:hypothetical protein
MAFDELLSRNVGIVTGFALGSLNRWIAAANAARSSTYTIDAHFENLREQFVAGWDTWNKLTAFAGYPVMPTVSIRAPASSIPGESGAAWVGRRLTGATLTGTVLEPIGGGTSLPLASYDISMEGDFDGRVSVTYKSTAAAPAAGTYRGAVLAQFPSTAAPEPIAWIFLHAA